MQSGRSSLWSFVYTLIANVQKCVRLSLKPKVEDGRLHPWCRHLANWTKHTDSGPFAPLYENVTSSIKALHCRNSRTTATCNMYKKIRRNLDVWFLRYSRGQTNRQTNKQTDRQTDTLIAILCIRTWGEVIILRMARGFFASLRPCCLTGHHLDVLDGG